MYRNILTLGVLLFAIGESSGQQWTKRTTTSALGFVRSTSQITGFICVGQPLAATARIKSAFGWIGFLPVGDSVAQTSVDEESVVHFDEHAIRLIAAPNPSANGVTIDASEIGTVMSVAAIDDYGRHITCSFVQLDNSRIRIQTDALSSGAVTLVVAGEHATGTARIILMR